LLTLILFTTLLMIAAAAAAPTIMFQVKRDREEELVHRGVQYSRAIRRFVKKTGRFPSSLDELTGTGERRFIRKLYKDPITGKDFKLLHWNDIPPLTVAPAPGSDLKTVNGQPVNADGSNPGDSGDGSANNGDDASNSGHAANAPDQASSQPVSGQDTGIIFGVASTSRAKSIREFNRKNHYNQWKFFYDPHYDRGYEITGPTSLTPAASLQASVPSGSTSAPAQQPPPQ
jgi:type II secretory pathway pseudopilin PulG